jgi:serine/threonine protein kinase
LDSGATGEVWIANDKEINRLVVVKNIKPDQEQDSLQKALFHLDEEVTGYLEHHNISPVYRLGQDTSNRNFYAMRYFPGRKLKRAISEYHSIPSKEREKRTF